MDGTITTAALVKCRHEVTQSINIPSPREEWDDPDVAPWPDDAWINIELLSGKVRYQGQEWDITSKDLPASIARRVLLATRDYIACAAGDCHPW